MHQSNSKLIIAVTGASGSIYAHYLLKALGKVQQAHPVFETIVLVASEVGKKVYAYEMQEDLYSFAQQCLPQITCLDNADMFASIASGSAQYQTMIVLPCSMGTAAKIAAGLGDSLITRAAQVIIKEQNKLILAVRETPLSLIHLRALTALSEAGVMICPAAPAFYSRPQNIEALVEAYIERILQWIGVPGAYFQWQKPE